MITKETAREIYNCYQQIEEIDKIKSDMVEEIERARKLKEEDNGPIPENGGSFGKYGKGMFIFMRPADELHVSFVAKDIKSLPQRVKDYYYQDCVDENGNPIELEKDDMVKFTAYICMKAADGSIVNGWLASQTDMLANDWMIFEF